MVSPHPAPATRDATAPVTPGQLLGDRYLVHSVLAEGGMGLVCSATHVGLEIPVAIKLIHAGLQHDEEAVRRFQNEARIAASLQSERIARVFDIGQLPSGEPYLVMEHLDGVALDEYVSRYGPLEQAEAVDLVIQACEALSEAHARGLVHRDIKPGNLFLVRRPGANPFLKVLDFGISKHLDNAGVRGLTDPSRSLGSPWYMAPEQMLSSASVDQRADVWSLGVLLFELMTKSPAFGGETVAQVCASVMSAPAPSLSAACPNVSPGLDAVLLRCLEKRPERRYLNASELARALEPFRVAACANAVDGLSGRVMDDLGVDPSGRDALPLAVAGRASSPGRRLAAGWSIGLAVLGLTALGVAGLPVFLRQQPAALGRAVWHVQPKLQPGPIASSLDSEVSNELSPLLQEMSGQAVPELDEAEPGAAASALSPEEIQFRKRRYEAWLESQGFSRLPADAP